MITLISLIIVAIGIVNWFTIGALQYDFIAGLFGSQANIFSRIIYVLVGIAGIFLAYSIIRNKGKLVFKTKSDKALFNFGKKAEVMTEAGNDNYENKDAKNNESNHQSEAKESIDNENREHSIESAKDTHVNMDIQNKANRINDKNRLSTKDFYTESAKEHNVYREHKNDENNE